MRRRLFCATPLLALAACSTPAPSLDAEAVRSQVLETERAFARTMAQRDLAAFEAFIADDAVFFNGSSALRGKAQVLQSWRRHFQAAQAPFSWEPAECEVLDSQALAVTSGPVRDAAGQLVARFTSVWRHELSGQWRIIFDRGDAACERC